MKKKGFTLIEIIIYIGILSLVVVSLFTFSTSISSVRAHTYVSQEVNANMRTALQLIQQKIRSASGVNIGSSVLTTHPGVLSLAMSDPSKNPTVIDSISGRIRITEGSGIPVFITSRDSNVSSLVFSLVPSGTHETIWTEIKIEPIQQTSVDFVYPYKIMFTTNVRQ